MRKISLFAVAATLAATTFGMWTASSTNAHAPSLGQGIDPLQLMTNTKGLARAEFADYTFVFH